MQEYKCLLEEKQLLSLDSIDVLEKSQNYVCMHMLVCFGFKWEVSIIHVMFRMEMCVFLSLLVCVVN